MFMKPEIYLDNNATTSVLPDVREAMVAAMSKGIANPSSAHTAGERARVILEDSRQAVANLLSINSEQLIFTSGGTEANNTVLFSALNRHQPSIRIITTTIEHSSVLSACNYLADYGAEIVRLEVGNDGKIKLEQLTEALRLPATLVSIQWVNNETGVIQPIEQIVSVCQKYGVPLHVDAAQAVGKIPLNLQELPIDFLTFSGHKFHGPSGIGGIYSRDSRKFLTLMIHGGGQERGLRAGTENLIGIAGLGKAATLRLHNLQIFITEMSKLRDEFEATVLRRIPLTTINGDRYQRVCNTTNICFSGVNGEALIAQLDAQNIYCSQSSACTSNRPEPSYVLRAMGLDERQAYDSVRFSFSQMNNRSEIDRVVDVLADCCRRLRAVNEMGFANLEVSHS